jgi:hypothetical protein
LATERWLARLVVVNETIYATVDFPADPFEIIAHFTHACSALQAMEREYGNELRTEYGAASVTQA